MNSNNIDLYGEDKITRESNLFLNYIHNFRAIAIILIVLGHSISYFSWSTYEKLSVTILFSNGTVLFVFISGFLMQHLFFKHEHREFYKRKIRHVVLPYLLSSIPAIIIFIFFLERDERYVFEGFGGGVWTFLGKFFGGFWKEQLAKTCFKENA